MDDLIIWLVEKYGGWTLIVSITLYLAVEFGLDIVHDLVLDWLRPRIDKWKHGDNDL